jgi:hypothetical protein
VTISGNTAGSTVGSTPGITFSGPRPGSTFLCSTPAGPLPASFTCGGPLALTTGNNPGHGGPLMVGFVVPPGRTLRNCVTVSQGAGPNPDVNRRNDTNICASFTRPVGPR